MTSPVATLIPRLEAWAHATHGPGVAVSGVRSLGGHSMVTVGFDMRRDGAVLERLVLKLPPQGVNRQNNFDVLRQVPILQALQRNGVPAPLAVHWSDDDRFFGSPYLMMSRLPGASLPDLFGPLAGQGVVDAPAPFGEAVAALVRLHGIDARRELGDWNAERLPPAEIAHWLQVMGKSSQRDWIALAHQVHDRLLAGIPAEVPIGVVHGDYYSNNWVFDAKRLAGIVDWEGASIGPSLLDLGWLAMMYDRQSWGPVRRASMNWHPGPDELIALYRRLSPRPVRDVEWYRALAGYRLACITAYYVERHRSGRIDNPAWEVLGESAPFMLRRALALLQTP